MLLDFTIENYGPFRDESIISLEATSKDDDMGHVLDVPSLNKKVLKSAVVFGPNSSGKSYLFEALTDLQDIISVMRPEGYRVPGYKPFRLSRDTLDAPVRMRLRMLIGKELYDYCISYNDSRILGE